jgi:hypothetical protein
VLVSLQHRELLASYFSLPSILKYPSSKITAISILTDSLSNILSFKGSGSGGSSSEVEEILSESIKF